MEITPQQIQEYGLAVVAIVGALSTTVLVPALIRLSPMLVSGLGQLLRDRIKGSRDQTAFDSVTRAGVRAASVAADVYVKALDKATAPNSSSGAQIDHEELDAAMREAWETAKADLERQGVAKQVIDAYGGEERVHQAIVAIIRNKLFGSPLGPQD